MLTLSTQTATPDTMTSLQIAEVTGKPHNDIMKAIRAMEPAWEKVNKGKFSLISYTDSMNREKPCYQLTKTECLYIATKFNDEARARIILRWEQLERERQPQVPQTFSQALLLAAQQQEQIEAQQRQIGEQQSQILQLTSAVANMEPKVSYMDKVFKCTSTVKTKVIAQDYGMSAVAFNRLLHSYGVQYRCGDDWILYAKYVSEGYVKDVPFEYEHKDGSKGISCNRQWTQKGRAFLYQFLKERDILPLIEQQ